MPRVFIVHGWGGNPNEPMLFHLRKELESRGVLVFAPAMPHSNAPKIIPWVQALRDAVKTPDAQTFFVGHSIGCQTILRYLETLSSKTKVGGIVLIAPWMHLDENTLKEEGEESARIAAPWMETPLDFEKVKARLSHRAFCQFSDNDPYVPLSDVALFKQKLGAETLVEKGKGHFSPSDHYNENPVALEKLREMF